MSAKQTIAQLLEYMKLPHVKGQALEVILSLTGNEADETTHTILSNQDLLRAVSRSISGEEKGTDALTATQILINVSSDQQSLLILEKVKAIGRCFELLRALIKPGIELKSSSKEEKKEIDSDLKGEGYLVISQSLDQVGALFMLLNNLTRSDEGKKQLMRFDKKELTGAYLRYCLGWFLYFEKGDQFLFSGNVLVNITSLPEAREWWFKEKDFQGQLTKLLKSALSDDMGCHRLIQIAKIIRNMIFDYENRIKVLLTPSIQLVAKLSEILLKVLFPSLLQQQYKVQEFFRSKEWFEEVGYSLQDIMKLETGYTDMNQIGKQELVELIVECFLLLTNSSAGRLVMKNEGVTLMISYLVDEVSWKSLGILDSVKDKMDAVRLQIV